MGGMLEDTVGDSVHGVPFLSKIPLLGYLFKHERKGEDPKHLLIFITATVINEDGNFVRYQPPANR